MLDRILQWCRRLKPRQLGFGSVPASRSGQQPSFRLDDESPLFRYTTGKWLAHDNQYQKHHHVKFDVYALLDAASDALGSRCLTIAKMAEGGSNKVYRLQFENGSELIARIPHQSVTPAHLVVASEVATMTYLREKFSLPLPKVIAWSSDPAQNRVGAEYILMELASGVPLGRLYSHEKLGKPLYRSVVEMETQLSSVAFARIGSLYFKEDVDVTLQDQRLYAAGVSDDALSDRFRIGPSVAPAFWRGGEPFLDIDRGPWCSVAEYMQAIVKAERALVLSGRHKSTPGFDDDQYSSSIHLQALERLSLVLPYLAPPPELSMFCLWHPDLSTTNILIHATKPPILTAILDWQFATTAPLYWQVDVPPCFQYNGSIADIGPTRDVPRLLGGGITDEMTEETKQHLKLHLEMAFRHKTYTFYTMLEKSPVWGALRHEGRALLRDPLSFAGFTRWDSVTECRHLLLLIETQWQEFFASQPHCPQKCPISSTEADKEIELDAIEAWQDAWELRKNVAEELGAGENGWTFAKDYEDKKRAARALHRRLWEKADETERKRLNRWWPYPDLR